MKRIRADSKTYVIETVGGQTFKKIGDLAERYGMSKTTVREYKKGILQEVERYGKYAVIDNGQLVYINEPAFLDYMANKRTLKNKNARKYLEPFNPAAWMNYLGYFARPIYEEKDEEETKDNEEGSKRSTARK